MPWGGDEREDDPDATEFIRELANETPTDLGEGRLGAWGWVISFVCAAVAGVQVFNLTKTLPAKPYGKSGPKLLTRSTTRRAWNATFQLMQGGIERVAMLGVPGIGKSRNLALGLWHGVTGNLPEGFRQPEAIVYEAREGAAVFLFTKGQDGKWKAQRLPMSEWAADACPYLRDPNNWYLVDAFEEKPTNKFDAKTWLACSPDRKHYSDFVKSGGQCVYVEAFSWAEVEACCPHFKTQVEKEEMLRRFQQVGGAVRTLLADEEIYNEAVEQQEIEADDFTTVQRAFVGDLNAIAKKMPTRLFTYRSVDGIKREVKICSPGVATLLVKKHYDKLVGLWKEADNPKSRHWLEDCVGPLLTTFWPGKQGLTAFEVTNAAQPAGKRAQWNRTPVNDFQVKEGLQLLECDTEKIFHDRWQAAVKQGGLKGKVLHSPDMYPGIDYLLEFNHGIQVTNSQTHTIAETFRQKLQEMFESADGHPSFTLTFLITGDPERFAPVGGDFNALRDMAGSEKLFDNVRVQVVQIPKTLNSLS